MIASDEMRALFSDPDQQQQEEQQQLSNEERVSSASSEEPAYADHPSLTPAPETPIEVATFVVQLDEEEEESIASEGPAVDSSESGDEEDVHDEHQEHESTFELSRDDRLQVPIDTDYNPEAEYLSDPDFHDERPGKKSLEEIEHEQRKRRESFRQQTSSSPRNSIGIEDEDSEEVIGRQEEVDRLEVEETISLSEDEDEDEEELARATSETVHVVQQLSFSVDSHRGAHQCEPASELSQIAQTTFYSSSQVTATEDRAELFADDESTLADDLGSLVQQQSLSSNSNSNNLHSLGGQNIPESNPGRDEEEESGGSEEDDEDSTLRSIEEVSRVQQPSSLERQESLDDVSLVKLDEVRQDNEPIGHLSAEDHRSELLSLLNEYCHNLVQRIQEEAIKQMESVMAQDQSEKICNLSLRHAFQIESEIQSSGSSQPPSSEELGDGSKVCARKIYTSSMYYNDKRGSFPTIEQQVERSQTIAKQLEDVDKRQDKTSKEGEELSRLLKDRDFDRGKAISMFKRRRERMRRFTVENSIEESESEEPEEPILSMAAQRRLRRASLEPIPSSHRGPLSSIQLPEDDERQAAMIEAAAVLQRRVSIDLGECDKFNRLSSLTDTEYEAPKVKRRALPTRATTTTLSERKKHIEQCCNSSADVQEETTAGFDEADKPKYKPFLDSSTLKDIKRLRHWLPYEEFNEHSTVSPEICLKIVHDLKSVSPAKDETTLAALLVDQGKQQQQQQEDRLEPPISKGQRLFERRQLQSSEWIVGDSGAADEHGKDNLSRASISEETVMVADESSNEQFVAEILPVVLSHRQPELELATVTKTPSFSTSSWCVIECESPDLLTSRDEPDEGDDGDEDDQESDDEPHDDDDETLLDEGVTVALPGVEQQHTEAETRCRQVEEASFASIAKEHTCQLHQATTLEWRPKIMTPVQLITNEDYDGDGDVFGAEQSSDAPRLPLFSERRASSLSLAPEPEGSSSVYLRRRSNDSVLSSSSVGSNYRQTIEQSSCRNRSYYYPHGSEWITRPDEHFAYRTTRRRESFSGEPNHFHHYNGKAYENREEGEIWVRRKEDGSCNRAPTDQYQLAAWRRPENRVDARASSVCAAEGANASHSTIYLGDNLWRPNGKLLGPLPSNGNGASSDRNSVNGTLGWRPRDEFGGNICPTNDADFRRRQQTGSASSNNSWTGTTSFASSRRPVAFTAAAAAHEPMRPMSAIGGGEVVCDSSRPMIAANRTGADQRRAQSLQRDFLVADGSFSSAGLAQEARLLSHAQTSSHSRTHHKQTTTTATTSSSELHQLHTQNSVSSDYPSGQQQHSAAANHYQHHDAMLYSLSARSSSDNWRQFERDHTHLAERRLPTGGPPALRSIGGHSASLTLGTEGGGAAARAATSSLVAQSRCCRCPCHLSPQCNQLLACSPLNGADQLWIGRRTESSCDNADASRANSEQGGNYRICIKLPQKVNKIVVCRRPQLQFATKINDH